MSAVLDAVLSGPGLRTVFQPLVDLSTGRTVAVEALSRGPAGSALERPDELFAAAAQAGRTAELDWACRIAALQSFLAAGGAAPLTLFLNAEPSALTSTPPPEFGALVNAVHAAGVQVVLEVTERALAERPAELLRALEGVRRIGWAVAVDDVGAEPASLALLPLIAPDVVKLDLRLVQRRTTVAVAEIVNAVRAEAERSGARLLAEGIETPEHAELAASMGAELGQGWLYGRPGPLAGPYDAPRLELPLTDPPPAEGTPWQRVADCLPVRRSTKPLLVAMSKTLERQALSLGEAAVVVGAFQTERHVTEATRRRYASLADSASFVAALATGLDASPAPGVRHGALTADDPLAAEWDVAVVGPHFAAALVARDLGDAGAESERRFDYTLTYDRAVVLDVAARLISRVSPDGATDRAATPRQRGAGVDDGLLARAVRASTSGVCVVDAREDDQPLVFVNEAFEHLTGWSAAEALGRNCRFMQGPQTDPDAVATLRAGVRQGRRVTTVLQNVRPDGTTWWNEVLVSPVHDASGTLTHFIGMQTDVTARVEAERRLAHLAAHDGLTGLLTRRRLRELLDEELVRASRTGSRVAVVYLDLDDFSRVNDTHGHQAGDEVLQQVAARLRSALHPGELAGRLGGDEFAVVLPGLSGPVAAQAATAVDRLQEALGTQLVVAGARWSLTASSGVALAPDDGWNGDELLAAADRRMYEAKRRSATG